MNETPQFPQYEPPLSPGIPVAHPKFHAPLYKLAKMLMKPVKMPVRKNHSTRTVKDVKHRDRFY